MKALANLAQKLLIILNTGLYDFSANVGQPKPMGNNVFDIEVSISTSPNKNLDLFWETMDKTLSSLSMSDTECANYKTLGMETYTYCYVPTSLRFPILPAGSWTEKKSTYKLRTNIGKATSVGKPLTNNDTEYPLLGIIFDLQELGKNCYELYDNIGTVRTPYIERSDSRKVGFTIKFKKGNDQNSANINVDSRDIIHLLYTEPQLSKLQNISVRPYTF